MKPKFLVGELNEQTLTKVQSSLLTTKPSKKTEEPRLNPDTITITITLVYDYIYLYVSDIYIKII